MVRLATRSLLHLTPELVSSGFDHPFYAKVVRVDEDTITFRSLEGGTGTVSREVANQHVVTSREINKAGELSLLRRPVSVQTNGVIQYGQVIATDGDTMTIDTDGNQVIALACDVSHVPPIVALMLQHAHFSCDEWNGSDLEHLQSSILDRIPGQHGEATKVCSWIDPQTGVSTEFQLQHAIDFAFFVDGGQHPVPDSVGQSFCQPPGQRLEQERIGGTGSSTNEGLQLFDPFVDDEEDQLDHSEHDTTGMSASIRVPTRQNKRPATIDQSINFDSVQQHSQKRRRMESSAALDKDAMIIERLGDDPELLDRFLSIRQGTNSLLSKTNDTSETKAAAVTTSRKKSDPTSKYSFVPRLDQEYVHDQVTSEKHKGKTPSVFLTAGQRLYVALGAVEKKDIHPSVGVRLIHDLSFPKNDSVNAAFVIGSVPKVRYESVVIIAQRIEYLAQKGFTGRIRMLKGDVKSAFRHLMTIASQTFRMAAFVPELSVLAIDMAAPFGWAGSPPYYSLFGRAISWLMGNSSPSSVSNSMDTDPFFSYEWVDDRIRVEPAVGNRLQLAAATLRHAMLAVLGYRSINESKFSTWSSEIVALGLLWNTERRTVSIPRAKIAKARGRVSNMIKPGSATKTEFYKVLGSLRHVTNCLRTAKPFYQQLQAQCNSAPRFGKVMLSP